jgi:DNA-binding PadR family transcriptional regulator
MSRAKALTTTTYAVLGLLAVKSWTTYELVQQVERSLRRIWPRAQSKLYEEPKKLVALGLARAAEERVGGRARTRYTITPKGRRALARWVREPGDGPVLEFEQLVKIHFADSGTKDDVLTNLRATLAWVEEHNAEHVRVGRAYLAGEGEFPQRAALNLIVGRFLTDFHEMLAEWARWAIDLVEDWPDDVTDAPVDREAMAEAVGRAERVTGLARSGLAPPDVAAGRRR